MKYYLPTYDEAKQIVNYYNNLQFYELEHIIDGYKICIFNYRLIQYSEFFCEKIEILKNEKSIFFNIFDKIDNKLIYEYSDNELKKLYVGANIRRYKINFLELRGLTFVFNKDGSLYKRFLLMNKFFNLNQVESTQFNLLKDLSFKNVYEKIDGSVISFIELPNKRILAKSKMMVDNFQALESYSIYEKNNEIKKIVKWCIKNDYIPIFEYISPKNRIVVKYKTSELILLRIRNNKTGEYLDLSEYPDINNLNSAKKITKYNNLIDIVNICEKLEDTEGFIVQLENDQIIKLKTLWYINLHHKIDDLNKEHKIIQMILNNTIDDYLSILDRKDDLELLNFISKIENVINNYIKRKQKEVFDLISNYNNDVKDFALKYKNDKNFHLAIKCINGYDFYDIIIKYLIKNLYRLNKCIEFLNTNGNNL